MCDWVPCNQQQNLHRRCWMEKHPVSPAKSLCNEVNYQQMAWGCFILCILKVWGIQGCPAGACSIRRRMAVWGSQSCWRRSMGIWRHWVLRSPLWESLSGSNPLLSCTYCWVLLLPKYFVDKPLGSFTGIIQSEASITCYCFCCCLRKNLKMSPSRKNSSLFSLAKKLDLEHLVPDVCAPALS